MKIIHDSYRFRIEKQKRQIQKGHYQTVYVLYRKKHCKKGTEMSELNYAQSIETIYGYLNREMGIYE